MIWIDILGRDWQVGSPDNELGMGELQPEFHDSQ